MKVAANDLRGCADVRLNDPSKWNPSGIDRNGMAALLSHPCYGYVDGRVGSLWVEMICRKSRKNTAAHRCDSDCNSTQKRKPKILFPPFILDTFESERARKATHLIWLTSDSFLENDLLHTVQINGLSGEWCCWIVWKILAHLFKIYWLDFLFV